MTIYRYDMSIPVRVVSALHSGGVDEVPERPITDEDGRTVQPNAFVRNGLGEAILAGRSIKGAIRAAFEEHMKELDFSEEDLKSLLKAALLAPSSMGKRPVECIVVRDRETIARLKTYKKHGTTALESAPLAIVVAADAKKSDVWVEDASIAATFLQVEAEALGLGSNWIQLRRRESATEPSETAFRRELGLPDHYGVLCVIAVGHKAEDKKAYTDDDLDFTKIHYETF